MDERTKRLGNTATFRALAIIKSFIIICWDIKSKQRLLQVHINRFTKIPRYPCSVSFEQTTAHAAFKGNEIHHIDLFTYCARVINAVRSHTDSTAMLCTSLSFFFQLRRPSCSRCTASYYYIPIHMTASACNATVQSNWVIANFYVTTSRYERFHHQKKVTVASNSFISSFIVPHRAK